MSWCYECFNILLLIFLLESRMHAAILSVPTLLNEKLGAMIVFADEDSVSTQCII